MVTLVRDIRLSLKAKLAKLGQLISHFRGILDIPQKATELEVRIATGGNSVKYMFEDYDDDIYTLGKYRKIMEQYKISVSAGERTLREKVAEAQSKIGGIKKSLDNHGADIAAYERCIRVLDRIDRENHRRNEAAAQKVIAMRASGETAAATVKRKHNRDRGDR